MIEGEGFRFDPAALFAFADTSTGLAGSVTEAQGAVNAAGELPAGVFGEVGESSGFVAAYAERVAALAAVTSSIGRGMDGLGGAVRDYVNAKLQHDDSVAADLRRAGEPV